MFAPPLGVVLAGGAASRLPGKPLLELRGRPLIAYPLAALHGVLEDVVVVAKSPLPGLRTWVEPAEPRHPLCGILHALSCAGDRAILVCAADMPLIDERELRAILAARAPGVPAVVPRAAGRLQPLCALYEQSAVAQLKRGRGALTAILGDLPVRVLDRPGERYANVNTLEDLDALR